MARNYNEQPISVRDLAKALAWEEVDANCFDLSWYIMSMHFRPPTKITDDKSEALMSYGDTPEKMREPGYNASLGFKTLFISRDPAILENSDDCVPDDYKLMAFIDTNDLAHLITYADGMGFEYTDRVNWGRCLMLARNITTKSDWCNIIDSLDIHLDNRGKDLRLKK